jgi:hypothetical protein
MHGETGLTARALCARIQARRHDPSVAHPERSDRRHNLRKLLPFAGTSHDRHGRSLARSADFSAVATRGISLEVPTVASAPVDPTGFAACTRVIRARMNDSGSGRKEFSTCGSSVKGFAFSCSPRLSPASSCQSASRSRPSTPAARRAWDHCRHRRRYAGAAGQRSPPHFAPAARAGRREASARRNRAHRSSRGGAQNALRTRVRRSRLRRMSVAAIGGLAAWSRSGFSPPRSPVVLPRAASFHASRAAHPPHAAPRKYLWWS